MIFPSKAGVSAGNPIMHKMSSKKNILFISLVLSLYDLSEEKKSGIAPRSREWSINQRILETRGG